MRIYYTGSEKEGLPQENPALSLGGYVSGSLLPNGAINNLFGGISQYGKEKMIRQVRAVVLKNESGVNVDASIWYDNVSVEPITNYRLAFVALASDDCGWFMEAIDAGDALPINAVFINPKTSINSVTLPTIPTDGYIGIWVERTYNEKAIADSQTCQALLEKFKSENEYQVSSMQFTADVSDSLDGTSFNLDTVKGKYMFWFTTGAGALQPATSNREVIRVTVPTDASADAVAMAVNGQIELLLLGNGEISSTIDTNTVTITSSLFGSFPIPADVDSGMIPLLTTAGTFNGLETLENMELSISY